MAERPTVTRLGAPVSQLQQDLHILTQAETPLDVGRPAADIFAYLADVTRHVEWAHTYLAVEPLHEGALAVGSRFRVRERQDLRWDKRPYTTIADQAGLDYTTEVEITVWEPERELRWRSRIVDGSFLVGAELEWQLVLEPVAPEITTLRMGARLDAREEALVAWMRDLLARGYPLDVLQRQVDRAMHNLRTILEGRA